MDSGIAIVNQGIDVAICHRDDRASASTITPTRAAFRYELLTTKCNDAIAAVTGVDFDGGFINEFHWRLRNKKPRIRAGLSDLPT
jgi:hypothetical protein